MAKTLIDPHCHYHSCFPIGDYWDCAWDNFYRASVKSAQEPGEPILCLTDMSGTDWFGKIQQQSLSSLTSHWQVHSTNESEHFRIMNEGRTMHVIASRQVNSAEGLEVLIVGLRDDPTAQLPLKEYITRYHKDYLIILPWGLGKWLGKRGACIDQLFEIADSKRFVLGDNGGRPSIWSNVPAFSKAKSKKLPILAGSDPLPLKNQLNRVAAYGIIIDKVFPDEASLVNNLIAFIKRQSMIDSYGSLRSLPRVLVDQFLLRFR